MRFSCRRLGRLLILLGCLILAVLILPTDVWPFCLAFGLIAGGVCLLLR